MKPIRNLLIFSVVLIATLFYFFQHTQRDTETTTKVNTVSLQTNDNKINVVKTKHGHKNLVPKDNIALFEQDIALLTNAKKHNPELDYITAYRDWQYFENCYTDIEDFKNNKDPLDTLKQRFVRNPRESQTESTPQQLSYYQYHVDICRTLMNDVGGENDSYSQIRNNLKLRFQNLDQTTAEEKQLAHAIEMAEQLLTFKNNYSQAHKDISNLSAEEVADIETRIDALTERALAISNGSNTLTPEQTQELQKYDTQIEALISIIANNNIPDYNKIAETQVIIDGYLNSIDDYLHQVKSPDAFILLAQLVYKHEFFNKDSTVLNKFKTQTGIKEGFYIEVLTKIVVPLVACSMNYPCDAESDLILSYCLGLKDSMFNQACGKSLEDFYFNFYIGPNQLEDVNHYFNYLVNKYAQ